MQITAIKTDSTGYKLIAANKIANQRTCKPVIVSQILFDYKDGLLRQFSNNQFTHIQCTSFREAVKYILSL